MDAQTSQIAQTANPVTNPQNQPVSQPVSQPSTLDPVSSQPTTPTTTPGVSIDGKPDTPSQAISPTAETPATTDNNTATTAERTNNPTDELSQLRERIAYLENNARRAEINALTQGLPDGIKQWYNSHADNLTPQQFNAFKSQLLKDKEQLLKAGTRITPPRLDGQPSDTLSDDEIKKITTRTVNGF